MTPRKICGQTIQYETPNWNPLLDLLAECLAVDFMWMHEVELKDGTRLHAYKHRETRRYLHLSPDGRAFVFCEDDLYCEEKVSRELLDRVISKRVL
jgi:hypothetical protein